MQKIWKRLPQIQRNTAQMGLLFPVIVRFGPIVPPLVFRPPSGSVDASSGACAMTTNLTINFELSKFYCRGVSHKTQHFGRFSSLPPMPPPSKTQILFLFCRLADSHSFENLSVIDVRRAKIRRGHPRKKLARRCLQTLVVKELHSDTTLLQKRIPYTRAVPVVQGDDILKFWELRMWWILGGKLCQFPQENRLNICHRKPHHILDCKKRNLSPGTHSGSILAQQLPKNYCPRRNYY